MPKSKKVTASRKARIIEEPTVTLSVPVRKGVAELFETMARKQMTRRISLRVARQALMQTCIEGWILDRTQQRFVTFRFNRGLIEA